MPRCLILLIACVCTICAPQVLAADAPTLVLPMNRTAYIVGEKIPLAVSGITGQVQLDLVTIGETRMIYTGPTAPLVLDTAKMAAGTYGLQANGTLLAPAITLTSPLRESPMGLPDESNPGPKPELRQALRETGVTAVFNVAYTESTGNGPQSRIIDHLAATGTMLYLNPTTRPSSFFPARGSSDVEGIRHRYALYAQANGRYPNFGGFWYDWDAGGIFGIHGLMLYFGLGKREDAFRAFSKRRDDAVYDDFRRRTGMEPVTQQEFMRYSLSTGRPEFAQNIDYVAYKLNRALSAQMPKMTAPEQQAFETRLFAWNKFVMGVYAEAYTGHQQFLRTVMPSIRNTSSQNIDHNTVRGGHWHPASNAALDFRYMSTWNDQVGSPDYADQWLITAGVLDIDRQPGQPVWISSTLAMAHGQSPYPGKFQHMAGHILGYGGTGLGNACEGFSTVLTSMAGESIWPRLKDFEAGMNDLIGGREFLTRFAALAQQSADYRKVAVLYSQRQFGIQDNNAQFGTPPFQTFTTLAQLGYHPRFITETMIEAGALRPYQALVITNQVASLPEATLQQIQAFTQNGGQLFIDEQSTISLTTAKKMAVKMPFAYLGQPHNWGVINAVGKNSQQLQNEFIAEFAPGFYAALGDGLRTPLMSNKGKDALTSTFALSGGADATYVVAVNDAPAENQARWAQNTERLVPNGVTTGVLYDLTKEQALGTLAPVDCAFEDLTARVYGILARPAARVQLMATQRLRGGEALRLNVGFLDAKGKALQAAIPFHLAIVQPDGTVAAALYRATDRSGAFTLNWPLPANAPIGDWTVQVRSQLDGMTSELPVKVVAAGHIAASPLRDAVVVRGRDQIEALLKQKTAFVIPLFEGPQYAERLAVARKVCDVLAKRGVPAEIRERPAMTTYTISYDATPEQARENARARNAEAFGKIVQDVEGYINHYEAADGGYIFGKPTLLLDLTLTDDKGKIISDNPLAERLDWLGGLWPQVSAVFPGEGKATVQCVKSAFAYGVDTLVIQATDCAGLETGAKSLAALPADWVGTSVAQARTTLLAQFGIGHTQGTAPESGKGLTANGLRAGKAPQPLSLTFGKVRPPTVAEVKPFMPGERKPVAIANTFKPQQLLAQYFMDGKFIETVQPLAGDCRFFDALLLNADIANAGPYTITVDGVFRYNDREPECQGSWDAPMAAWNALPKQREAMAIDVYVDGKLVGSLTAVTTAQRTVSLYIGSNRKAEEEVVVKMNGQLALPAGVHQVIVVPRNMVDGKIATVTIAP